MPLARIFHQLNLGGIDFRNRATFPIVVGYGHSEIRRVMTIREGGLLAASRSDAAPSATRPRVAATCLNSLRRGHFRERGTRARSTLALISHGTFSNASPAILTQKG